MPLSPLLDKYDHVLLDLDGCVWVGDQPTPGAPDAIAELRTAGKSVSFLTNDSRRSPEEYVRKLWNFGIKASLAEVVTVGSAIQHMLAEPGARPETFVIGAPSIFRHVGDAGARIVNRTPRANHAQVVVVAGHDELDFGELRTATQAVLRGAQMIATDRDPTFPEEDGLSPGTGAIVAALEYATGHEAQIAGKPRPQMFHTALDRLGPGRALVVGDRIGSDLAGAAGANLDGALVLTGVTTREQADAAGDPKPVAIADTLHALVTAEEL